MKIKKIVLAVTITLVLIVGFVMPVNAAEGWYTCYVTGAGKGWDSVYIRLKDASTTPSFTENWFTPPAGQENQVLAAALTAQASGLKVWVYTNPTASTQAGRLLYTFYVLSE